jgi:hypothetical protein
MAFDAAIQASLAPDVAQEVIRQMKNPPDACVDKKDVAINYTEAQNFGLMQVKFKDNKTFEINSGWEPIETAEIT